MSDLTIGSVIIDRPRDGEPACHLQLWTDGGRLRKVDLTEYDLLKLIAQASDKLALLKGVRT